MVAPARSLPEGLGASLRERLAFERLAVRVYEAAIAKLEHAPEPREVRELASTLRASREQERSHAAWLEERLRELGQDPFAPEIEALSASLESLGICGVILSPHESLARTFHALVGFEILDAAGWRRLVELAEGAVPAEASLAARVRLWEEQEHEGTAAAVVRALAGTERPARAA